MKEHGAKTKLLEAKEITKTFLGNTVLDTVSFDLDYGEVLGLVGQNGAGKSTLVKALTGAHQPDSGTIFIEGKPTRLTDIQTANACGIALVFQELSQAPNMTVADNIYVGNIPTNALGIVDRKKLYQQARELIERFAVDIKPDDLVENLTVGKRQIVEILKAISKKPKVLILDEPTSSLEESEIKVLFKFIEELKKNKLSIIYISHHMSEIFEIVDRVMVLRDGKKIGLYPRDEINVEQLISLMIGQQFNAFLSDSDKSSISDEPILEARGLTREPFFRDMNLVVNRGEIVGIAGIVGSGKTELCQALYGDIRMKQGEIYLNNKKIPLKGPSEMKQRGILFIPENRKTQGLFLYDSAQNNTIPSILSKVSHIGFLKKRKIREIAEFYKNKLKIKLNSLDQTIRFLSGGNQQKVLVAKCVAAEPKLLIAMDPTRGIDIASKADIHRLLHELARKGMGIIMVSSDLDELINMCDRIVVMNYGKIGQTFLRGQFNTGQILLSMHQSNE